MPLKRSTVTCQTCGTRFDRYLSQIRPSGLTFCTRACFKATPRPPLSSLICEQCGKAFHRTPSQIANGAFRRCSTACFALGRVTPLTERFWSKVRKTENCWFWTGSMNGAYGQLYAPMYANRAVGAHRVAWTLATGEVLVTAEALLHTCDTPACVRNDDEGTYVVGHKTLPRRGHLAKGTLLDNNVDQVAKGHINRIPMPHDVQPRGEGHGRHKLTEVDVAAIRHLASINIPTYYLAERFGVHPGTIGKIIRREKWRHVP